MAAGSVVDYVIADSLENFKVSGETPQNLPDQGLALFRDFQAKRPSLVNAIRRKLYIGETEERARPFFHEYHELDLGSEFLCELEGRVMHCLRVFEGSQILEKLKEVGPSKWGPITTAKPEKPSFNLEGHKVFSNYDLIYRDGDVAVILDWKSGPKTVAGEARADEQLQVYSLYGMSRNRSSRPILTQAVWLIESGDLAPKAADPSKLETTKARIRSECEAEIEMLDVRVYKNGRSEYRANRKKFPPLPSPYKCRDCNYQTICPEGFEVTRFLRPSGDQCEYSG